VLDFDGTRKGRRRDLAIAAAFAALAALLLLLPGTYQEPIRSAVRTTILRPFIAAQTRVASNRARNVDLSRIRAQRDSLAALAVAQAALSEENRRLRATLGLSARAAERFVPAQVLRLGTAGTESEFMVDVGLADSVDAGSAVIAPEGLLGVVMEADENTAQAIDWSHGGFRVSAMTADGAASGIVEPRRGRFREEDLLVLTGAPFHSDIRAGTRIVTSGRGELYPRGVPIGTVIGIDEADTGWRKSYLVRPAVRPDAALHVLVGLASQRGADLTDLWQATLPPDSAAAAGARRPRADTQQDSR
jgi:rod shape-determining protein MreC